MEGGILARGCYREGAHFAQHSRQEEESRDESEVEEEVEEEVPLVDAPLVKVRFCVSSCRT